MKRPSFQFYPADWRKDPALSSCSLAARGLWIELMCIAHECAPYGHVAINGNPMTATQIARQVGEQAKVIEACLAELESAGVFSRDDEGRIFSRRMVRDERVRNDKAASGKAGAQYGHLGAEHGKKGGRPSKDKGGSETPLPMVENPPPSSSSSSSTSVTTPLPPSSPSAEGGAHGTNGHDLLGEPVNKRPRKPAKHALREGWYPAESTITWLNQFLARYGLSEEWGERQHSLFVGKAKSNAWVYADWDQAYRNFMTENGPGGRYWRPQT